MPTTYAQKQTPAQKMEANSAASVVDNSSQGESLQRKADLANCDDSVIESNSFDNKIIQRYRYSGLTNFKSKHIITNDQYNADVLMINKVNNFVTYQNLENSKEQDRWITDAQKEMKKYSGKGSAKEKDKVFKNAKNKAMKQQFKKLNAYKRCEDRIRFIDDKSINSVTCESKLPDNDANTQNASVNAECITCTYGFPERTTKGYRTITDDGVNGYCHLE